MSATFVPAEDVIQVQMVFSLFGQTVENVLNFKHGNAALIETATALCTALVDWWDTYIKPYVPADVSLQKLIATDASSATGYQITYTTGLPLVGTANGAVSAPSNVTLAVKFATGSRGRWYHGRAYHVGLVASEITGNILSSNRVATLKTGYEALMGLIVDALPAPLVVVSKYLAGMPRVNAVVTDVLSIAIDQYIDSQKRRLTGRGR